jgi:hypothetical protein
MLLGMEQIARQRVKEGLQPTVAVYVAGEDEAPAGLGQTGEYVQALFPVGYVIDGIKAVDGIEGGQSARHFKSALDKLHVGVIRAIEYGESIVGR